MKYISLILSIVFTGAIFSMSMMSGSNSNDLSLWITDDLLNIINKIIPANNLDLDTLNLIIRKAGHVFEYLILGSLWFLTSKYWRISLVKLVVIGIMVASLDELIQVFSVDRGPSVVDILIFDFLPYLFITSLLYLLTDREFKEEEMISSTLANLANNKISPKKAYQKIYQNQDKPQRRGRAHFLKLNIHIPDEKGVNKLLKVLFFVPLPLFIAKFALRFVKMENMDDIGLTKSELIELITSKGIKVTVDTNSGEKINIKTI